MARTYGENQSVILNMLFLLRNLSLCLEIKKSPIKRLFFSELVVSIFLARQYFALANKIRFGQVGFGDRFKSTFHFFKIVYSSGF